MLAGMTVPRTARSVFGYVKVGYINYPRYLVFVMCINVLPSFCFFLVQAASFFSHIARYIPSGN